MDSTGQICPRRQQLKAEYGDLYDEVVAVLY